MKRSTKIMLTAAFIGMGLSGAKTVFAAQSQPQVAVMPQHHSNTLVAEASDGDGETNDDAKEQQESAQLQSLAKITPQQAQLAAERAVGAKASSVKLEDENGNLVYAVEIGKQEVKVDAGNGRVLYSENPNQEDKKNEASLPKSSIQVPQTNDGDREVNDRGEQHEGGK